MLTPPPAKRRLLVIEPDAAVCGMLKKFIPLCGFEAVFAASGTEGLQTAAASSFDLVLLNITLPGPDGVEVLRELHEKHGQLQVLMLANKTDIPKAQQALTFGAGDYITIPIDLPTLKRILQVHLPK